MYINKPMLKSILAYLLMVFVLISWVSHIDEEQCKLKVSSFSAYEYSFRKGCLVYYNDSYIPVEMIKIVIKID